MYEMLTPQIGVLDPDVRVLMPIFESPVKVSGNFEASEDFTTLTCQRAGSYVVSGSMAAVNDGNATTLLNKQADFDFAVNGIGQTGAVRARCESPMYDSNPSPLLQRSMPIPASTVSLSVDDTLQFWYGIQGGGGPNSYNLDTYAARPGALVWVYLERIG